MKALADALAPATSNLRQVIERHGLDGPLCFQLVQGHLRKFELLAPLRKALYSAVTRAVLLEDREPLSRFLEGEYTQPAPSGTRRELVSHMLHALVEMCALARQPVVIAFDNLELLFSPRNQFDGELTRTFWNVLAQAVDNTRGLLVLLFAETGLFEKAAGFMDSFARDRLLQGVPLFARGPVHEIRLRPPPPVELQNLVRNRVRRYLGPLPGVADLHEAFPFPAGFLQSDGTTGQNLRNTLLRLRDAYTDVVYRQTPMPAAPAPAQVIKMELDWDRLLQSVWDRVVERDRVPSTAHLPQLHAGLKGVLEPLLPHAQNGWELTEVQATASLGDHPTYGVVSVLRWREQPGSGSCDLGVGFLLGRGMGMPVDLGAKLDFFRRPAKGDHLVVLWPPTKEGDNLVELLPAATRSVWDQSRHRKKATLRRIEQSELRTLLAVPDWLGQVSSLSEAPPPAEALKAFIVKRFQPLLQLLGPPPASALADSAQLAEAHETDSDAPAKKLKERALYEN
jgi:hypothetical protein